MKHAEYNAAAALILETTRLRLAELAASTGAQFVDASTEPKAKGAPAHCFRLIPSNPRAATVEVSPELAESIYIGVGVNGWIEMFASPKRPAESVADAMEVVEAIAAGRLTERIWRSKKTGEVTGSSLRIQNLDGNWAPIGYVGRPLPVLRKRLDDESLVAYEPYVT